MLQLAKVRIGLRGIDGVDYIVLARCYFDTSTGIVHMGKKITILDGYKACRAIYDGLNKKTRNLIYKEVVEFEDWMPDGKVEA